MRITFLGSGSFGLPSLKALIRGHEVPLIVTQPDRPAGRARKLTPTPIAAFAEKHGIPTLKFENVNEPAAVEEIRAIGCDCFVVIAFGQKLGRPLLDRCFAINLHASLLPKFRGAAPINWAIIRGERTTGVSVITLASEMDAGDILGMRSTVIDPLETAGELHDRLAELGPELVLETLVRYEAGALEGVRQASDLATRASKLTPRDGRLDFTASAAAIRQRIHGLTPWPGCSISIQGKRVRLHRVRDVEHGEAETPGCLGSDGRIRCGEGWIEILALQPAGGRLLAFAAWRNGLQCDFPINVEPVG